MDLLKAYQKQKNNKVSLFNRKAINEELNQKVELFSNILLPLQKQTLIEQNNSNANNYKSFLNHINIFGVLVTIILFIAGFNNAFYFVLAIVVLTITIILAISDSNK